jgi:diacylglycerol kinase (ATP)
MLTGIRDAVIVHNPAAGWRRRRREQDLAAARHLLAQAGMATEVWATGAAGSATELARKGAEQNRQLVIVCGGDGTLNEVANGLAGSQVPLAVLPAGTANVLAKEMGLPWDIPAAARLIPGGRLRRIALGLAVPLERPAAPRYFLCVAGAGPDAAVVYSASQALKQRAGTLAYWWESWRHLLRYPFPSFQVTVGEERFQATLVMVGRTKHYGGPFQITTGASLFEDQFELAIYTTRSRFRYVLYLSAAWLGRLRRLRDVHFIKANSVRCLPNATEPIYVQVDGEPADQLPMEFRIVPDALTLVIPEGRFDDELAAEA